MSKCWSLQDLHTIFDDLWRLWNALFWSSCIFVICVAISHASWEGLPANPTKNALSSLLQSHNTLSRTLGNGFFNNSPEHACDLTSWALLRSNYEPLETHNCALMSLALIKNKMMSFGSFYPFFSLTSPVPSYATLCLSTLFDEVVHIKTPIHTIICGSSNH